MTFAERLTVEGNAGLQFVALEAPVELLSYITAEYMTPGKEYGKPEIDTLHAMLELILTQLYDVLAEYDMLLGRIDERAHTKYILHLASEATQAARHNELSQHLFDIAHSSDYLPEVKEKALQARTAAMQLPDKEAIETLEKALKEIGSAT